MLPLFHSPWKNYSVFEMDRFELGEQVVYVAQDRTCVFIEGQKQEADVHQAREDEIENLWEKHHLVALLPVFQRIQPPTRAQ
ncbi:MAG TPA: hypothetical protein VHX86_07145 [Tepidisphaeraceae bacterium]|jgi:hypothetical protein|nr:hypothetical protein [Tepidisphaeraceae bacterium]